MVIPESIRADFEKWNGFMEQRVEFWNRASVHHTKAHCRRVLLFALMLADARGLSLRERDILAMASVFHDSRRQSDMPDIGHGWRAAEYYKEFCELESGIAWEPLCAAVMRWHDRRDEEGVEAIRSGFPEEKSGVLLYQMFKDSDALDRFRLGPRGLDVRFLRTDEARALCGFAERLWTESGGKIG